jgi:hypothetical protein
VPPAGSGRSEEIDVSSRTSRTLIALAAAVALFLPVAADAATIDVHPGPNAIQRAVNRASPGDVLRIHDGTYPGSIEVTKRVTLKGVGGVPTLDARCRDDIVIDVVHNGVTLRKLKVQGAALGPGPGYAINLVGIATGTVDEVAVKESCDRGEAPEYGINVHDAGNLRITGNHTFGGFADAGIYVGAIDDTLGSALVVRANESDGNNRGVIIQDSFAATAVIRVIANSAHHNRRGGVGVPTGIYVHNSDHGFYAQNRVNGNGDYGLRFGPGSDDNEIRSNRGRGNGGFDLFNQGIGNCGSGENTFATASGNPLEPC